MENPLFLAEPGIAYPISWFRKPFSLLDAMFCRLYGEANCTHFKLEWVLATQHIILTGESFNWAQVLSLNLQHQIEKYLKGKKLQFYMSTYVMDFFVRPRNFLIWVGIGRRIVHQFIFTMLTCGRIILFVVYMTFATFSSCPCII